MTGRLKISAGGGAEPGARRGFPPAALAASLLLLLAALYLRRLSAAPPFIYDELYYFSLAKYLLAGHGYVDACFQGAPAHLHYPPLTSLIAAAGIKVFGENYFLLRAVFLAAGFAALLPAYFLIKKISGKGMALAVVVLTAASGGIIPALSAIRSDLPYLLFSFAFLLQAEKLRRGENCNAAGFALTAFLLAISCLTRELGATLLLVLPAALLAGSPGGADRKKTALFSFVCLLAFAAYSLFSGLGTNYANVILHSGETWQPSMSSLPLIPLKNAYAMIFYGFPAVMSGLRFEARSYFALTLSGLVLAGFIIRFRRERTILDLYFAIYLLTLLLAPATDANAIRILTAVAPAAFLYLLSALEAAAIPLGRNILAPLTVALLAAELAASAFTRPARAVIEADRLAAGVRQLSEWVKSNTSPGALFLSNTPHALDIYSGRKSVKSSHYFPTPELREPGTALAWIYNNNVDYIVTDNFWERSQAELYPAINTCRPCFEKRYSGSVFSVYEINKPALRARAAAKSGPGR